MDVTVSPTVATTAFIFQTPSVSASAVVIPDAPAVSSSASSPVVTISGSSYPHIVDDRSLMAQAHYNAACLLGKTVTVCLGDSTTGITGFTNLVAIVRSPSKREQQVLVAHHSVAAELIFEIPRQDGFITSSVYPQKFKLKYGTVYYEVINVSHDDAETPDGGGFDASIGIYAGVRISNEIGGMLL